ncbi:2',5'-phosphodiesterase 12 [Puntigrus tetrazona]|uniref:2',5'-phosphodiesterase 12 n=1 Tax=Puntigrus tetrazona TaxID=1606681 RepID=UPI001C8A80B8|nr:2',5'-phosphodiesterase 12 [Puntigrus tetrazona]
MFVYSAHMLNRLSFSTILFSRYIPPSSVLTHRSLSSSRFSTNMERCVVRCVPRESKLTISFSLNGSNKQMLREQAEPLGKALARIANSIVKGQNKAKKSKPNKEKSCAPADAEKAEIALRVNDAPVPEDTVNADAWLDGAVLHVGDFKYKVELNPPTFTVCELPTSIMAGFPVCPKLEMEFGDLRDSEFRWFKESSPNALVSGDGDCWKEAGRGRVFTPSNLDIGLRVMLDCTPGNGSRLGEPKKLVSSGPVEAGPGTCTFDNRHMYTQKVTDGSSLRVVSYNILADIYAQTDLSKTVLYPYCAPYALEMDYRQNLIKKELSGYNADIVCLQEVDKVAFADSLSPALDAFGLDGVFRIKEKQHEGLATYFRRSKLKMLGRYDIMLSEALATDALHRELLEKVSGNPSLKEKIESRSTMLQVTVLQSLCDPSRIICVGNTHLYWHPKGGNVRLVQIAVALRHMKQVVSEKHPGAGLIFSGDFNSTPSSGLFQLVCEGSVSEDHEDWGSGGPEERIRAGLMNPFRLVSACGAPAFTNYVGGFQGCLDYVFVEPHALRVEQVIPLPGLQEVTTCVALPSVSHPSDHIALVCDLEWK